MEREHDAARKKALLQLSGWSSTLPWADLKFCLLPLWSLGSRRSRAGGNVGYPGSAKSLFLFSRRVSCSVFRPDRGHCMHFQILFRTDRI